MANFQFSKKSKSQNVAQQLAQEPLEILKAAQEMIAPQSEASASGHGGPGPVHPEAVEQSEVPQKSETDLRRIEALNREIEDIQREKLYEVILQKIQDGEEIFVEGFAGLTDSQKQVLVQRQKVVAEQKAMAALPKTELPQTSKRGRRFGANKKDVAKREETRVEKPTPTSG